MLGLFLMAAVPVPVTDPATWITEADYPADALAAKAKGAVEVSLSIGPDGKPIACQVRAPNANASLNAATCALLMERARFATQSSGGVFPSSFRQRVQWQIASANPIAAIATGLVATSVISPTGILGKCTEESYGDIGIKDLSGCDLLQNAAMLERLASRPLTNFINVSMKLAIEPAPADTIAVQASRSSLLHKPVIAVQFRVKKTGFVDNCQMTLVAVEFGGANICDAFSKTEAGFKPDPKASIPKQMRLTIDLWFERRS